MQYIVFRLQTPSVWVSAGPVDVYSDEKSAGTDVWKKLIRVSRSVQC